MSPAADSEASRACPGEGISLELVSQIRAGLDELTRFSEAADTRGSSTE